MLSEKPMPTVSVVIPAYNGASRYLEQAMGSVLNQTFPDFELIVVDDASTDDTGRLVSQFPRARYVRRAENGGQATTRNTGAAIAKGEFLAFLDQDDLWEPMFLELTVPLLHANSKAALIHCDGYQVSEGNEILEYDAAMKHTASITQMLRGGHDVGTSGSLFRRSCFDSVGGYDDALWVWEDIDLAIRLFQRYPVIHLPKPLYRHRLYARNVSRNILPKRALEARRLVLEKFSSLCRPGSAEARTLNLDWSQYYMDLGKQQLNQGRVQEARHALWLALKYRPFNRKALFRLIRSLTHRLILSAF